jgi:hypothetical protein
MPSRMQRVASFDLSKTGGLILPATRRSAEAADHVVAVFGSKRIPLESGYYEGFNRNNVTLVDIRESPIERITPTGLKTHDAHRRQLRV